MRNRHDRDARLAVGRVQKILRAERFALHPGLEAGGGEQVVERHRQLEALVRGEERVDVHDADLRNRRVLDFGDQGRDIETAPFLPGVVEQPRNQDVLAAGYRISVHVEQRQDARRRRLHALTVEVDVIDQCLVRRIESAQHRHGQAGIAAWRVDGEVDVLPELRDALAGLAPLAEPGLPQRRLRRRVFVRRLALVHRDARIDPRAEVLGPQLGEGKQQVAHVALRVDRDDRDVVEGRFFEDPDAEPGFAGPGHADDCGMRGQVLRVVQDQLIRERIGDVVVALAEIERSQFLEVVFDHGARLADTCSWPRNRAGSLPRSTAAGTRSRR